MTIQVNAFSFRATQFIHVHREIVCFILNFNKCVYSRFAHSVCWFHNCRIFVHSRDLHTVCAGSITVGYLFILVTCTQCVLLGQHEQTCAICVQCVFKTTHMQPLHMEVDKATLGISAPAPFHPNNPGTTCNSRKAVPRS